MGAIGLEPTNLGLPFWGQGCEGLIGNGRDRTRTYEPGPPLPGTWM